MIKKANSQIKRADTDGVGAVFMLIERPQQRVVFDDALPVEVKLYVDEVERELGSGYSRSVGAVAIAWDDYMLIGDFPEPTWYVHRRRTVVREHRAPRRALRLPRTALEVGRTVALPIIWSASAGSARPLPPIRIENVLVTPVFRQECELPGHVRSVHAVAALREPDALVEYKLAGSTLLLATKWIPVPKRSFNLLLMGRVRKAGTIELTLGFRVYGDRGSGESAAHPVDVFMELLRRYGLPVSVGEQSGLLIPQATVELSTAGASQLICVSATEINVS